MRTGHPLPDRAERGRGEVRLSINLAMRNDESATLCLCTEPGKCTSVSHRFQCRSDKGIAYADAQWVTYPDSQGWWWHWDGEPEHAPYIYSVLTSLSRKINREFIAYPDSRWCCDIGGLWMKVIDPLPPSPTPSRPLPPTGVLQPAEIIHGEANPEAPIARILDKKGSK